MSARRGHALLLILLLAGLSSLPREPYEAARMDGSFDEDERAVIVKAIRDRLDIEAPEDLVADLERRRPA